MAKRINAEMFPSRKAVTRITVRVLLYTLLFFTGFLGIACNYSFKGANPPEGIRTIFIPTVNDQSGFGLPTLPENMTLLLKNKFINDNTLEYADKTQADGMIECVVKSITDEPLVVTGNEQVSRRKVTIIVSVNFLNLKKQKSVWLKDFTNWGEYDSSTGGFSKRDEGVSVAVDRITDDILIDVISNW